MRIPKVVVRTLFFKINIYIMSYQRVLPKDLFNEAKLLKCLGKLVLLIEDQMIEGISYSFSRQQEGFVVDQDPTNGEIFAQNVRFFIEDNESVWEFEVQTPFNSRENWPLTATFNQEKIVNVFTDKGEIADEFLRALKHEYENDLN